MQPCISVLRCPRLGRNQVQSTQVEGLAVKQMNGGFENVRNLLLGSGVQVVEFAPFALLETAGEGKACRQSLLLLLLHRDTRDVKGGSATAFSNCSMNRTLRCKEASPSNWA